MPLGTDKTNQNSLLSKWLSRVKKHEDPKGVQQRPEGARVPLSPGQQRLLFLQQLYPENPFYHYAEAYKFKGDLDVEILKKSFEIAAQRHEILRTQIVFEDGQAYQKINDKPLYEFCEYDLRNLSETDIDKTHRELPIKDARKSLDSPEGYLTRVSLLRLKEDEFLLVLTMHHIITDMWSMHLMQNEVAEYYRSLLNGEQVDFSPLEIQYADYAYWHNLRKPNAEHLAYWKHKLQDSVTFLPLPTDFPRPSRPTFRGALSTQKISAELSNKLKLFCRERNKTPYAVMLTAFKVLLSRYSGETDILVGSPVTNRDEIALENLIGFFQDTIVLRSDLSNDPTFVELLEQVWTTRQEAFDHKNMPFETLVKALKPDRQLNSNPLFQVMFIYHDVPGTPNFGRDLHIKKEPFDFGVTKFDLTLFVAEEAGEITTMFEYSKDLFEKETIERMQGHLKKLLEEIVKNPNQAISQLTMITDREMNLFSEWNNTNIASPKAKSVVELFNEQVTASHQKPAVSFKTYNVTYDELNRRANCVANYLLKSNPDKRHPIGILVEPSIDMIVGIVGVLKAGFAYLPLDSEYPTKRLEFILSDSSAAIVLTQKHLSPLLAGHSVRVQTIDEIINSGKSEDPMLPAPIDGEDLAYVIYTSGSTGQPKGVCVSHNNLVHSTMARLHFYPNQPQSFLLMSSFSFDSSVAGIFWTLLAGGKLVVTERRTEQDLDHLGEIYVTEKITHTLLLPTLYRTLIKNLPTQAFDTFKSIIVAGEACPRILCDEHYHNLPSVELYNEYGPTEATVWATVYNTTPTESALNVPIGKAIPYSQVYILDEHRNRVPIGVPGELFIGGKGVTKGYLNNYELTRKYFVKNNLNPEYSDSLYRTGDLCRYRADGTIEFLGRKDNQVKLRGYRIELGEIQEAILQQSNIRDVVVKLEMAHKPAARADETVKEVLVANLEKMNFEEADGILKSVENLSDEEIEFMVNQIEHL